MIRASSLRVLSGAVLMLFSGLAGAQTQNTTTRYQYDANGNLTQITDPLGRVTEQSYDPLNRLKQQLQPAPVAGAARPVIATTWDGQDQLSSVTDPRALVTNYTADGLGNRTGLLSPDTGATGSTYDDAGNLRTSTDARGKVTTYSYDILSRVTRISPATGIATVFEYDGGSTGASNARGHLTRMTDESGQTTYSYDGFGHLQSKVQTVGSGAGARSFTLSYTYGTGGSATGKLTSITYPSGNHIDISYDATGHISTLALVSDRTEYHINPLPVTTTVSRVSTPVLTDISYSAFGPVQSWTWGNSTAMNVNTYARGFDLNGRLVSYPLGNLLSNGLMRTVTYDAAGRITGITHSGSGTGGNTPAGFNQSYSYDDLDRLTGFIAGSTSQGFQYDSSGNRNQFSIGGNSYPNTVDAASNRLMSTTGPVPAKTDTYDAAGNLKSDGTISYIYSDSGRMQSATRNGSTVSYLYNGLGQRVRKSGPGSVVASGAAHYVYDEQGHLIGEYDASGNIIEETVYLGDLPVAVLMQTSTQSNVPVPAIYMGIYNLYADHLNTPRVIVNADNQMVWRWDGADPFGMLSPNENPSALGKFVFNQRFPGQLYDKETNLHYNYFRYYDPATGRYITSDPIGLGGGINTYAYVRGNPLRWSDRLGLKPGDPFPTPGGAAKDVLDSINPTSITDNKEYGGIIYHDLNSGNYYAFPPIPLGKEGGDELGNAGGTNDYNWPKGTKAVGDYHTHGNYCDRDGNPTTKNRDKSHADQYSEDDKNWPRPTPDWTRYLGTPSGTYYQLTPGGSPTVLTP